MQKKNKLTLITLALGAALILGGCGKKTSSSSLTPPSSTSTTTTEPEAQVKTKTMALQATTALTLADGFTTAPGMNGLQKSLANSGTTDPNIPVATLDILFNNGVDFNVEARESDRVEYEYLDVISFNVGADDYIEYSLYFNLETSDTELDDDDDELMPELDIDDKYGKNYTNSETSGEVSSEVTTSEEPTDPSSDVTSSEEPVDSSGDVTSEEPTTDSSETVTSEEPTTDSSEEITSEEPTTDSSEEITSEEPVTESSEEATPESSEATTEESSSEVKTSTSSEDEEIEKHYRLRGIALVGDEEYRFMSKTESEIDAEETETELRFMLWKDDNNFIAVQQEIEIEGVPGTPSYEYEEEFHYVVVENDNVVKDFRLEFENEDSELELEIRIDGVKYEVEYVETDGRTFLHVSVEGDKTYVYEKIVTTNEETGEVTVSYVLQ